MGESESSNEQRKPTNRAKLAVPTRVPWSVLQGLALLAVFVLLQGLCGELFGALGAGPYRHLHGTLVSYVVGVLIVALLIRSWSRGSPSARLGIKASWQELVGLRRPNLHSFLAAWKPLWVGVAAYVSVSAVVVVAVHHFEIEWEWQPVVRLIRETDSLRWLLLECAVAVVMAPVAEELLFRAVLYLPLRSRLGVLPAALIVSGVFSAVHLYPLGAAQFVVLSLTFVALFERTGTLWAPIVAHALYNALTILFVRLMPAVM